MPSNHNDPNFETSGTYAHDNLIGGDHPIVTGDIVLENGQNLERGAVLGVVTDSGEAKLSASGAGDGSETPAFILAKGADASAGAITVPIYKSGQFNEEALSFGTGHDADSVRDELRDKSIYLRKSVTA